MTSLKISKVTRFLPHAIFVSALFWVAAPQEFAGSTSSFVLQKFISLSLQLIPLAINLYILLPHFYFNKKWLYAGLLVKVVAAFSFLNYLRFQHFDPFNLPTYIQPDHPVSTFMFLFITMGIVNVAALFIKLTEIQKKERQRIQEEEKSRLASELKFLKLQFSPHFYFNILNSIYHSIKLNPEQAENITVQLSEMMQYHMYECSKEKVPLEKEIRNIHNYIALQKMRLASQPRINVAVEGDPRNKYITPLMLITFVENSFKHGLEKQRKSPFLDINLHIEENSLRFKLVNSKPELIEEDSSNGQGLSTLKERLKLFYPSRHALSVEESENQYSVLLDLHMN